MHKNRPKMPKTLPWWPKQLPWTSLRMMLDFPDACMPWIIMPPLVGRSDDKCSRTSRKSHFRPTNVVLDMDGTSKNRGLSGQFSLLKAGKIKNWTFYWIYQGFFVQALTISGPKIDMSWNKIFRYFFFNWGSAFDQICMRKNRINK